MAALNDQFNELVKVKLEKKQALMDDKNEIRLEVMNELAKSPISFMITMILINLSESILQLE